MASFLSEIPPQERGQAVKMVSRTMATTTIVALALLVTGIVLSALALQGRLSPGIAHIYAISLNAVWITQFVLLAAAVAVILYVAGRQSLQR